MSPQQVPNLVVEAINIAKTMRASFKTAEVAGYFGWAWVVVYRALKDGTPAVGPSFLGTDTYTAPLNKPTGFVGFRVTAMYHLVYKEDFSYEFAGGDDLGIFWDYEANPDGSVALEKKGETINHYSPDGNEPFFTYEIKADTPSFPRLNAPYNVRLGLTMKAPQVTRNQGPTANSRSRSESIQGGGNVVFFSASDTYTEGKETTRYSNSKSIALPPWSASIGPYRVNLISAIPKKTLPPELRSLLRYEVPFKIGLHVPMNQDALEAYLTKVKNSILWKLIKEGKVHFHLTGWASNIGRKHANPAKPNSFNNDDLAFDRVSFVRLKVMKNKFAMMVRDEDTWAPGIPATPNANPQVDQVVIISLDEAEVIAAL
jgi:hypothetical protein